MQNPHPEGVAQTVERDIFQAPSLLLEGVIVVGSIPAVLTEWMGWLRPPPTVPALFGQPHPLSFSDYRLEGGLNAHRHVHAVSAAAYHAVHVEEQLRMQGIPRMPGVQAPAPQRERLSRLLR